MRFWKRPEDRTTTVDRGRRSEFGRSTTSPDPVGQTELRTFHLAVQDVSSQRVMRTNFWMIKVTLGIVVHADSLHDATRANIVYGSKGNDLLDSHGFKTKRQSCTCYFLRVPFAPAVECQPPTNLHTRRKRQR